MHPMQFPSSCLSLAPVLLACLLGLAAAPATAETIPYHRQYESLQSPKNDGFVADAFSLAQQLFGALLG